MKKKIIILIVILVILAIGGCAAYAFLYTDLFKSDEEMFLTYLVQNISKFGDFSDEELEKYIVKQNNTPYQNNGQIYIDSKTEDEENFKLTFKGNVDKANSYNYQQIKLNYTKDVYTEMAYLQDDNYIAITIPEIIKKYLTLDTNNIKKLAQNLGIENVDQIPDKLDLKTNINFNFNSGEYKLKDNYKEILLDALDEEKITKSKTDIYTKYTYTSTITELKRILKQLVTDIEEDEEALEEIANSYVENNDLSAEDAEEYVENLKEDLQTLLEALNNETEYEDEEIKISVYVQGKNLMKTELIFQEKILTLQFSENNLEIRVEENDEEQLNILLDLNIKKAKVSGDLAYDIEVSANDQTLKAKIDFSGIESQEKVKEKYSISTENEVSLIYENTKQFVESIEKKEVDEKDRYILNTKSKKKLTNMFQQLITSLYQNHMTKMQEAGFVEDPINSLIEEAMQTNDEETENNENDSQTNSDNEDTENNENNSKTTTDDEET